MNRVGRPAATGNEAPAPSRSRRVGTDRLAQEAQGSRLISYYQLSALNSVS